TPGQRADADVVESFGVRPDLCKTTRDIGKTRSVEMERPAVLARPMLHGDQGAERRRIEILDLIDEDREPDLRLSQRRSQVSHHLLEVDRRVPGVCDTAPRIHIETDLHSRRTDGERE